MGSLGKRVFKSWGNTALYVILCGLFLIFLFKEKTEVFNLQEVLRKAQPVYLLIGLLASIATTFMHGVVYRASLNLLGMDIPFSKVVQLFLKRFFLSTFIPAGYAASQFTLSSELEEHDIKQAESHIASTLFVIVGGLSFVVMLVPTLMLLAIGGKVSFFIWVASGFAIALTAFWIWQVNRIFKQRGLLYTYLVRKLPELEGVIGGHAGKRLVRDLLLRMLPYSLLVDVLGAATLVFSALSLGVVLTPAEALMGYIINILVLTVSPLFQGVGFVEISLVYLLKQFGIPFSSALAIALVYRLFQMWLPFFAGMYLMFRSHVLHAWRHLPAMYTGGLGLVNILSYFRPDTSFLGRLGKLQHSLSPEFFTVTRGLSLAIGIVLVVLSVYLYNGHKLAWRAALYLIALSLVSHAVGGVDTPELVLGILVCASLVVHRDEYLRSVIKQ